MIGSMHCVGMCGPLALALPVHRFTLTRKLFSITLYQAGRVFTYSLFGAILGMAGRKVYLAGFQQGFSIVMGVIVLGLVLQYWIFRRATHPIFLSGIYKLVQRAIARFLRARKWYSFFLLGAANGLLPCGMVYVALAGALTTSSVLHSTLFMAGFGLGTLPAMMALSFFGPFVTLPVRNYFRKAIPVFGALVGMILILRGLNLGIPFISPVLPHSPGTAILCH